MDALFYSGAPPPLNMFTKSLRPAMATQQSRRAPWSVAKCRAGGRRRQCHYCFLLPAYPSVLQKDKASIVRTDGAARRGRGSNSTVPWFLPTSIYNSRHFICIPRYKAEGSVGLRNTMQHSDSLSPLSLHPFLISPSGKALFSPEPEGTLSEVAQPKDLSKRPC